MVGLQSEEDGIDRISNLSDDTLVVNILSKLENTKEVIRTSILSKRWKPLWTKIPSIDLVCCERPHPSNHLKLNNFIEFVDWVFENRSQDLESFRLSCSNHFITSMIDRWIHLAVMRRVKQLHLKFSPSRLQVSKVVELPLSLVSCDSLEELNLFLYGHALRVPCISGFQTLRVLVLNAVELSDNNLVQKFLVSCRLLEELSLINCILPKLGSLCIQCLKLKTLRLDNYNIVNDSVYNNRYEYDEYSAFKDYVYYDKTKGICGRLTLLCPSLVFLDYKGHIADHFSFDVQSLKKAVIYPGSFRRENWGNSYNTIRELFAAVSKVEYLSISYRVIMECDNDIVGEYLCNLKTLELKGDLNMMDKVVSILKCCPNLESLHLIIPPENIAEDLEEFTEVLDEVETRRIITRHLKRVVFSDWYVEKTALAAQLLLKHGNVLEEIVFTWLSELQYNRMAMEVINQVSEFDTASSSVKLTAVLDTSIFQYL